MIPSAGLVRSPGDGAQIRAVRPAADPSKSGLRLSSGTMDNCPSDPELIEQNHERFIQNGRRFDRTLVSPCNPDYEVTKE